MKRTSKPVPSKERAIAAIASGPAPSSRASGFSARTQRLTSESASRVKPLASSTSSQAASGLFSLNLWAFCNPTLMTVR